MLKDDVGQLNGENLDVHRAADRAARPASSARPSCPAVVGITISEHAAGIAHSRHVWQILDGHATEPRAGAPPTP